MADDRLLDEQQWREEAEGVIRDVKDYVRQINVSDVLQNSDQYVYLNITTAEGDKFCVQLSAHGFKIVGRDYDLNSEENSPTFETPYALLHSISPKYTTLFGQSLLEKLENLNSQAS